MELQPLGAATQSSYGTITVQLGMDHPEKEQPEAPSNLSVLKSRGFPFFVLIITVFGAQGLEAGFPNLAQQVLVRAGPFS